MLRRLPPLNALKAFEAAARHESFTRAAEELCVTQGAVSHQVKALEATLGLKLFNRERQRLVITEAGRDYLAVLRDAFDRIALGTARVVQRQSSGALTVSTSPDFAAKMAGQPSRALCRGASGHRLAGLGDAAPCRLRPRGGRSCGPPRRGLMAGAGRRAALLGAALSGLQPEADDRPQSPAPAGRPPAAAPAASRRLGRLAPVARGRRRAGRGSLARTGPQPGQHGDRRRDRRAGGGPCPHHARGLGPHQWAPRPALRDRAASAEKLLDHLPEGGGGAAEDSPVPDLAPARGGGGCEAVTGARMRVANPLPPCRQEPRARRAAPKPRARDAEWSAALRAPRRGVPGPLELVALPLRAVAGRLRRLGAGGLRGALRLDALLRLHAIEGGRALPLPRCRHGRLL